MCICAPSSSVVIEVSGSYDVLLIIYIAIGEADLHTQHAANTAICGV